VGFKIAAKPMAKRFEPILPNLIHLDQTDFVKMRYKGENIRLISDIMAYTKLQKIPGILVSLDFCKDFDSIEWPFIMKTLDYFNFGSDIKRWVVTFYTNIESTVLKGESVQKSNKIANERQNSKNQIRSSFTWW